MAKFIDSASVTFKAGDGGNGIVAFHREKFVDKGGPSGGDGGNGGSVFLVGDSNESTLYNLNFKKILKANPGGNGEAALKHGRTADDLMVQVPLGTIVFNTKGEKIGEVLEHGQRLLVARGGHGGRGNAKFKSSVNTVPRLSENGTVGEEIDANLELKILADVALVGYPSVGKSTLISMMTNAKPKIAEYHFTTLNPNIGISSHGGKNFVIADIPGLIEGASEGKGLGIQFLKHIERCKYILHLLDGSEGLEEMKRKHEIINKELAKFSKDISILEQKIVINKIDLMDENEQKEALEYFNGSIAISALDNENITDLKAFLVEKVQEVNKIINENTEEEESFHYYRYNPTKKEIEVILLEDGVYEVRGTLIDYWARRIPITTDQNYARFRQKLITNGIFKLLEEKGWKDGDIVEIAINGEIFEFE